MPKSYHPRNDKSITQVINFDEILQIMETQGQILKRIRTAKGLTQTKLAKLAKVSQGTVGNVEADIRGYGESVVSIARVLGVEPEELQGGKAPATQLVEPEGLTVYQSEPQGLSPAVAVLVEWIEDIKDPALKKDVLKQCLALALKAVQTIPGQPTDDICASASPETRAVAPPAKLDH